uniref:Tick transposon n=1 Tax=Rhipicephalus appendiculatus TaxID=34631 RepID=A0A131YTD6_RHIAP
MLCDVLLRALPQDIVVQYHRWCAVQFPPNSRSDSTPVGLDGLLNFLCIELECIEKSDFKNTRGRVLGTTPMGSQLTSSCHGKHTSSVLHSNSARETKEDNCVFCSSSQHKSESCIAELPLTQKKELLSNDKRCFRCTTKGHRARDCKRKISCSRCKARHATSMCDPDRRSQRTDYIIKNEEETTTVCASLGKRQLNEGSIALVFLQTFRAWAINDDTWHYI